MPTYEYVCAKCDGRFEKVQPMAANALTVCPKELCCRKKWGKGKVKRAISTGGGLIFKGSGFYTTDYRSDKYKEAAKKDSAPASAPASDSKTSSTDAKPATTKSDKASESKAAPSKGAKAAT